MVLENAANLTFSVIVSLPIVISILAQVSAQLFKVVLYSITERRFAIERLVNAAGLPSAHTAFVVALTASIGLRNGLLSDLFAISFVFAAIVVYDSFRLRGHVQRHAQVLNQLLKPRIESDPKRGGRRHRGSDPDRTPTVSEHVGHTLPEVAAGVIWGLMFAVGLT